MFSTQRENDDESDLMYYRVRHYSPRLGRFIRKDPYYKNTIAEHYIYARNSPLYYCDPTGADTIAILVEKDVSGAIVAKNAYKTSLENEFYTVKLLSGYYDTESIIKDIRKIQDFVGLITIGHGWHNHSCQLSRSDLMRIRPSSGYKLLALQSCHSYDVVNRDGAFDEAGDLMAKQGLLMVNYGYSTIVGNVFEWNMQIRLWCGNPAAAGKQAGNYRIFVDYAPIIDATIYALYDIIGGAIGRFKGKK